MALSINRIKAFLGLNYISVSSKFSKAQRNSFYNSPRFKEVNKLAKSQGVDVNISPARSPVNSLPVAKVSLSKTRYEHVADVPDYAMKFDTGDAVYIPITEEVNSRYCVHSDAVAAAYGMLKH